MHPRKKEAKTVEKRTQKNKGKETSQGVTQINEETAERQEFPNISHRDIEVDCRLA